jgi:hypothetical protein
MLTPFQVQVGAATFPFKVKIAVSSEAPTPTVIPVVEKLVPVLL